MHMNPSKANSEFLALEEVSAYLKIAKSTIYKLSQKGELPSCKIGKQLRFRKSSIDKWIAQKESGSTIQADSMLSAGEISARPGQGSKSVLLIDDDDLVLRAISRFLANQEYKVETARNAEEALEKVEKSEFDLVITDIRMPGIDGIETIKRIRQVNSKLERPPVKEVIITGYLDTPVEQEAQRLGITDYVYKPFSIAEFLNVVKGKLQADAN